MAQSSSLLSLVVVIARVAAAAIIWSSTTATIAAAMAEREGRGKKGKKSVQHGKELFNRDMDGENSKRKGQEQPCGGLHLRLKHRRKDHASLFSRAITNLNLSLTQFGPGKYEEKRNKKPF